MPPRLKAFYYVRCDARSIEARARALAVEQSVEMPVAAIEDPFVSAEIVGQVETIAEKETGLFEVCITFLQETVGIRRAVV
jgi:ribulose-bisphosphate carboxylase large chain